MNEKFALYLMGIWERASHADVGLSIEVNDRWYFERKMREARQQEGGYEDLAIFVPDVEGEVWLVKKGVNTNMLTSFTSEVDGSFGSILRRGDIE